VLFRSHGLTAYNLIPHGVTSSSGPRPPYYRGFTITLRHTTLGRTPLGELSAHIIT
jgi:hypothetical protein